MDKMTNDVYVAHEGALCPFCGGDVISAGNMQTDSGGAWQGCLCEKCDGEWTDEYKLVGYSINE